MYMKLSKPKLNSLQIINNATYIFKDTLNPKVRNKGKKKKFPMTNNRQP